MARHATRKLGGATDEIDDRHVTEAHTRAAALVGLGAAFAANCTTSLRRHLAQAAGHGVDEQDVRWIVEMVRFIKGKAASHVERIAGAAPKSGRSAKDVERGSACDPVSRLATEA